ncbi:MAG: hypothetical protein ACRDD4_12855 [Culicoidibacterales bacterium]
MKKVFTTLLLIGLLFTFSGCSGSDEKLDEPKEKVYVPQSEINKVYSNPDDYIGQYISLTGQVFGTPEFDDEGVYFQMWANPSSYDLNTVVIVDDPSFKVQIDDYIKLEGVIIEKFEGENSFGGLITALQVITTSIEVSDYISVMSPTVLEVVQKDLVNIQNGVETRIDKVEFAENETRVYYSVTNNTAEKYSFYDYGLIAVQNGKQINSTLNWEAGYPEVSGDILSGITVEGVIAFPAMEQSSFDIHFDSGYSYDWDLDFTEFVLSISLD